MGGKKIKGVVALAENQEMVAGLDFLAGTLAEETHWLTDRLSNHPDFPKLRVGWKRDGEESDQMAFIAPFRAMGEAYGKHFVFNAYLNGAVDTIKLGQEAGGLDAQCWGHALVCRPLARVPGPDEPAEGLVPVFQDEELQLLKKYGKRGEVDAPLQAAVLAYGLLERDEDAKRAEEWIKAGLEAATTGKAKVKGMLTKTAPCDVLRREAGDEEWESYFRDGMQAVVCLAQLDFPQSRELDTQIH